MDVFKEPLSFIVHPSVKFYGLVGEDCLRQVDISVNVEEGT